MKFYTDYFTFMGQRIGLWGRALMDQAYITDIIGVGLLLILVDYFAGWTVIICMPDKKKFDDKTDSKGHIFQKRHNKNPGTQQCTRIL